MKFQNLKRATILKTYGKDHVAAKDQCTEVKCSANGGIEIHG